jgi:hypothetical protein
MGKKPRNSTQMALVRNAKKQKVSKSPFVTYPTANQVERMTGIRMSGKKKQSGMAKELFGEELNADSFTWQKYCGQVGISVAQIFGFEAKLSEDFVPQGWTDATKLSVRPKTDGIAIMIWSKEFEEELWCHVSSDLLETMHLSKNLK